MALDKGPSINKFLLKTLWILSLAFHEFNLVICDDLVDDNLKKAVEAIERRQRDFELQGGEYYGQPENIGYGFQKTLGFFDSGGPLTELGSYQDPQNDMYNYERESYNGIVKSNFRELNPNYVANYPVNNRDDEDNYDQNVIEYAQIVKNLWPKYTQSRYKNVNVNDLPEEQVEEIVNSLAENEQSGDYGSSELGFNQYKAIPIRKSYRIFDGMNNRLKRYPSFGEGIYGKRNVRRQRFGYGIDPENDFLYSLNYASPDTSREAIENLREGEFEMMGDEKDGDMFGILNNDLRRPDYSEGERYWPKNRDDEGIWLKEPVPISDDLCHNSGESEKRAEPSPRFFKAHNGIHLNSKRFPVKRNHVRIRKEVKNDTTTKEIEDIFSTSATTTNPPKKFKNKMPIEPVKKQNLTKPVITKHREGKKVPRSVDSLKKPRILTFQPNKDIVEIFKSNKKSVDKKSIDWSQYFGIDKRNPENWIHDDYLRRAESHFLEPKNKRFSFRENNGLEESQYQVPFDTRRFNKKNIAHDIENNIDRVEDRLGSMEQKIIDDAVKYTGAHSGSTVEDLGNVKNKIIQHLEAAYSLEKVKSALEEFKNLMKAPKISGQNLLRKGVTETPKLEPRTTVLVPKENSNLEKPLTYDKANSEGNSKISLKKENFKGLSRNTPQVSESLEFLGDDSDSNRPNDNDDCPLLDTVLQNCLPVEESGGDFADALLALCSVQQLCYFCGNEFGLTKRSSCDSIFMTEAQYICQDNIECLMKTRNTLMRLKSINEQGLGERRFMNSCFSNSCVKNYFLNYPRETYSAELRN